MEESQIRQSVAGVLEITPEELAPHVALDSFDTFDSVGRLSLMVCLSDLTGRPLELSCLEGLTTYGDILKLVNGHDVS